MICFIIKYSPRNDDFERELGQMLYIFDNYISNITIVISKSEDITNKRKEEIMYLFKNKFGIENTIFTTKKTNGYDLCEQFNKFKNKMKNIEHIIVKTRDLAKTVPSLYNKDMAKEKEIYEDKFNDALEAFKKEVEKATDPDLKRALYFAFKDYKDKLLEEYSNTIRNKKIDGKEPDPDSVVTEVLMFDNLIFNEFDNFRKLIEKQIEVKSSNYNGEYNRFKKCPHCGIIWFKVIGCNSVVCGNRTTIEDKIRGKYKEYDVSFVNNKIIISSKNIRNKIMKKDDEFFGLTKKENIENLKREKEGKIAIKPLGCGRKLDWKEMEDCSEEVISKLKEISIDDYYSGLLDISKNFNQETTLSTSQSLP